MHDAYKLWALCCVVQAPVCMLLISERGSKGYTMVYHDGQEPMVALYVIASLLAAFHIPFVLTLQQAAMSHLTFWLHVACVHFLFVMSALKTGDCSVSHIVLLATTRFLCLLTVCVMARGSPLALSAVHASAYSLCVLHAAHLCSETPWMLLGQVLLDALLWLGHKWDTEDEEEVEQNAHLFYLSISCCLLHVGS